MKNRLKFLKHNYNLEKNVREIYENLISRIANSSYGILPQPSVFVQTGGSHTPNTYLAQNSSNLIQGNSNNYSDSSEHNIIISHSFNQRQKQISKIDEIVEKIKNENIDSQIKSEVVANLNNIKEEITEEQEPSKNRIFKWLNKTKNILKGVVLAHHTEEAIQWLYESFNFIKDSIK